MADTNLNTSISAVATRILNAVATANADELTKLASAALFVGESENELIETAINTRVNTLITNADADTVRKLASAIKKMKTAPQSDIVTGGVGDISELTDTQGLLGSGGSNTSSLVDMSELVALTGMSLGDQAYVQSNNNLFFYNGTGWYKIATLENLSPTSITGVNSSYELSTDGTPTVITATSTDPEGFPLTWSYQVTSGTLGTTATVSQSENVFTITPGTTDPDDEGTFEITFSVTDGTNGAVNTVSSFTLQFAINFDVNLDTLSYDNVSLSVDTLTSGSITNPMGMMFSVDGQYLYVCDNTNIKFWRFTLSTPWDLSTAGNTTSGTQQQYNWYNGLNVFGGAWKPDGTKFYALQISTGSIESYTPNAPWDITNMQWDNSVVDISGWETTPSSIKFNPDGTKMFFAGSGSDTIHEFNLSTPWDHTTLGTRVDAVNLNYVDPTFRDFLFNPDGTKMLTVGQQNDTINQFSMSTGYDLSFLNDDNKSYAMSQQSELGPRSMFFKDDGTKLYVIGTSNDAVLQYSTGI